MGGYIKLKGLDLLLEAFASICEEHPEITLIIAGPDGGYTSEVQKKITELKIGERVLVTGALSNSDILSTYVDANVYVLPSYYDLFPNTVLEAWACGTPVIMSESCGLSTIAQNASIIIKRNPVDLAQPLRM